MPFNGTGQFLRIYNWVNDAAVPLNITASRVDTDTQDIANGLSNCITRDGQGKPTAAIDFNGQALTNVATLAVTGAATVGTLSSLNYVVGLQTTVNQGTFGFINSNGPGMQVYGTAAAVPGSIVWVLASGTPSARIDASGNFMVGSTAPKYQSGVIGPGQATSALTDAGVKGASLMLQDTGIAAGNGGALLFGAGNTALTPFAALKAKLVDATTNSVGDLAFSTRNAITDTALTERWVLKGNGDLVPSATYNIGTTGLRVGTVFAVLGNFSSNVTVAGGVTAASITATGALSGATLTTTGDNTGPGLAISRSKSATTNRASTTTLADDPDLIVPVGVGRWAIDGWVQYIDSTSVSAGFKWQIAFSGTGAGVVTGPGLQSATPSPIAIGSPTSYASVSFGGTGEWVRVTGYVIVTGAGNLSFQWAQNASNAQATSVLLGSWLNCTKVA